MVVRDILVNLEHGLEARPIALLVQEASKYDSKIYIQSKDRRVNAKSIMVMMSLVLASGSRVVIDAAGDDEEKEVAELSDFLTK